VADFVYAIVLDPEQAKAALGEVKDEAKKSATEINSSFELAGKAFDLIKSGASFVVEKVKAWTEASAEAQETQRLLATAVGAQYDKINQLNSAIADKLKLDDDDLAATELKLLSLGVQKGKLEDAMKATLGYAAATGKELPAAAKAAAKAIQEGGNEAQRMIDLYAIAEAQAETFSGRVRGLEVAWGDLDETMGAAVTESASANEGISAITDTLHELNEVFQSPEGKRAVDEFFGTILTGAADAIDAILGARKALRALLHPEDNQVIVTGPNGETETIDVAPVENSPWINTLTNLADRLRSAGRTRPELEGPPAPLGRGPGAITRGKTKKGSGGSQNIDDLLSPEAANLLGHGVTFMDQMDQETKEEERRLDIRDQMRLSHLNAELERDEFYAKQKAEQQKKKRELQRKELEEEKQFTGQLIEIGVGGVTNFLAGTISAWGAGQASLADAAKAAFGGMLAQIGQGLIALGSSAVAAGLLGTVAPIFAAGTGGPAGVAAGLGLIAAGGALVGFGSFVSGAGAGASGGAAAARAGAPDVFSRGSEPRGFDESRLSDRERGGTTIVIELGKNGTFIGGTRREVGTTLLELIDESDSLSPGRRRLLGGS
jgi:hypothetical protein